MPALSPKQVVAFLEGHGIYVNEDTVRAWTMRGVLGKTVRGKKRKMILKCSRVGGRIHILQSAVFAFIPHLEHVQE